MTPIPGVVVLSTAGSEQSGVWTQQIWPPPTPLARLVHFTPERHVITGADEVGCVQEPAAGHDDLLLTVISGRVAAGYIDLRPGRGLHRQFLTELDAGSSVFAPAGVAFGFQVLAAPARLSLVLSSGGGRRPAPPTATPEAVPGIAWPIPRPAGQCPAAGLDAPARPYRVLFVCTANICRSAYADAAANARPHPGIEFGSAGVQALVGRPIDPPMAECLPPGVDASGHRASQLTRDDMVNADLVLAMASEHRRYILEEWPDLGRKTFVLGHVAREIENAPAEVSLEDLTNFLWHRRTTDRHDDVPDPYRRGPDAAHVTARKIDGLLDAVVGKLGRLPRR